MTWADDAVAAIAPWYTVDYETYVRGLMSMFAEVELFADDVLDDDGNVTNVGWSILFDPDRIPAKGLPYLAQWVGERLPQGLTEAEARTWVKNAPNQFRGTPYSVARAAQRWLTGSQIVQIRERSHLDGTVDSDYLAVQTFTVDTPDPGLVLAELRKVVPGDIVLDFQTTTGATWADVHILYTSWGAVSAANPTWADVAALVGGFVSWAP